MIRGSLHKFIQVILALFACTILSGCLVNSAQRTNLNSTSITDEDPTNDAPVGNKNYFEKDSVGSTTLVIESNYTSDIFLRGRDIHPYLKQNTVGASCFVANFPQSKKNEVLVIALKRVVDYDYQTNLKEYHYRFSPADAIVNKLFCNTPAIQSIVASTYPTRTISFDFKNVCDGCVASFQNSGQIDFYSTTGEQITDIDSSYLDIRIDYLNDIPTPGVPSCTDNSQCSPRGFDCCSGNICVDDKALKPGAKFHADYPQASAAFEANQSSYKDWPNIYFMCENFSNGTVIDTPVIPPTSEIEPFQELQELYECTNPIQGEMSVCTIRYEDITAAGPYTTGDDDRHFGTTYSGRPINYTLGTVPMPSHGLYEVSYAGKVLFEDRAFTTGGPYFTIDDGNDILTDPTKITNITYTPGISAPNNDLTVRYTIDGSCTSINSTLAKCYKIYIQGKNLAKTDDHFPASNKFLIPIYADTSRSIIVEVDGYRKQKGIHWTLAGGTSPEVLFLGTNIAVQDTQLVKISFYVDLKVSGNKVLQQKKIALDRIVEICKCSNNTDYCNLRPVYDGSNTSIINYECTYSDPSDQQLEQKRFFNFTAKSVPHRLFDPNGVPKSKIEPTVISSGTGPDSIQYQEGNKFEYINGDLLKPNNVTQYIGFNEIYGSFSDTPGSAEPAKEIAVEKSHTYNIIVRTGNFSSCLNCGTDYYGHLSRLFPDSFGGVKGGGYNPELLFNSTYSSGPTNKLDSRAYRADDMKFGRACYVPATMIPWTHAPDSDRKEQRLNRLSAQHFLFSNGYQRDWFGFDYGALIGSFDGVSWFAIGNERQIRAKGDKLYLAINGHFGDLTEDSTFGIIITDITISGNNDNFPTEDHETTGAQCRKYHYCESDRDCAAQLGWDYACTDVAGIRTKWPSFDQSSLEIPKLSIDAFLKDIVANINIEDGGTKRCVYRGKGAPCHPDYSGQTENSTYHQTKSSRLGACSMNNYCQQFQHGKYFSRFNSKINRYGLSVQYKNAKLGTNDHTFGLGAPIIGRPLLYNGEELPIFAMGVDSSAGSNFSTNNVTAICIPGRDVSSGNQTIMGQHQAVPDTSSNGDKVNMIGMTPSDLQTDHFLSSCSIIDETNDYIHLQSDYFSKSLNDAEIMKIAGTQALSTNALMIFLGIISENDLLKNFESKEVLSPSLEENRCLRAAGSVCFTNFDCAPSSFISTRVQEIDESSTSVTSILNEYEVKYWKEDLTCAQKERDGSEAYRLKNNVCCRALGKSLTIGTYQDQLGEAVFTTNKIAGIDLSFGAANRNSRMAPVYKELKDGTLQPLEQAPHDQCVLTGGCTDVNTALDNQFSTFDAVATRTCCSQSWVRNFSSDENGGGHKWGPLKTQPIAKEIFKCLNWKVCPESVPGIGDPALCGDNYEGFSCNHVTDPDDVNCLYRSTSKAESTEVFNWLGTLEMTGVPQVAVKGDDFSELHCLVDYNLQFVLNNQLIKDTINPAAIAEYKDINSDKLYSATDSTNFSDKIKTIFSKDEVSCCLGVGEKVEDGDSDNICCSGFINNESGRCALPDYSNVSLYFNRNISSEGKGLQDNSYDSETGHIKDPNLVIQLACAKKACASGILHHGVALSYLKIPGQEASTKTKKRYVDSNAAASNFENIADYYDAGLKWNNHIYCFPNDDSIDLSSSTNFNLIRCAQ